MAHPSTLVLFFLCFSLSILGHANAQTRATAADLVGVVRDQTGAILPGATVTATNPGTNLSRTVTTEADGRYAMPALPPGEYVVLVELTGFRPERREAITLSLGTTITLDITLRVAGTAELVTVASESPIVDTQQTALASVVSRQQIENLPINGRNFISFSIITPAVTTDRTPQQGASATSGLSFAGQRARSNNITVDGLDNNDATLGAVRATFSQEAVQEFQVITNSYAAEFGKASGGIVNIVTKSGTNTLRGTAFFYVRDESLNAKERFEKFDPAGQRINREKAPYGQKQFGGTLGGPIKSDRTFFFGSFERLDVSANNFVTIDDTNVVSFAGRPLGTPAQILRAAGFPVDVGNVPYDVRSNQFLVKVDHLVNPDQSLVFRYNTATAFNENIEPFGGQVAKSRAAVLDSFDHMFTTSHTAVASSKLVNELRFQFARRDQEITSLDPNCGGPCTEADQGGPTLEVTGFASVGRQRFTPQPRNNHRYQLLDTLSYYLGNHQVKAGFDFNYIDNREGSLPLHFGGRYIFASALPGALFGLPVPTVNSIQAVALGLPAAYVQGYGDPRGPYKYKDLSLFIQDDWRLRDNLTVKAGLRYQNQFWPNNEYNVTGFGPYEFPSDGNNLAPRLAVNWQPTADRRTSVHAAYGIFFDNHITSIVGITDIVDGTPTGVRTLVARLGAGAVPLPIVAWNAPGHRLPEAAVGAFPSTVISIDPGLETPYAHQSAIGADHQFGGGFSVSGDFVYVRGFNQLGTIDYNPVVPALGTGRRPEDINGVAGTSASVLQYTSFGETWYKALTLTANQRFNNRYQFFVSYTLSEAEDNSTDFQSAFIPQDNGRGRDQNNRTGLPVGFNPDSERGPSLQDQRHRLVLSGLYVAPLNINLSSIITIASGRPYNILAGADLNGDGDGGAFPSDRARATPTDPASSIGRNTGTLPSQATVDLRVSRRFSIRGTVAIEGLFEVFNLFNRTNYTDIDNIFGPGAYPSSPTPTFGLFQQAGPPFQAQLAARLSF